MAKKGQQFNKYSSDLKERILKDYFEEGIDSYSLEKKYGVPHKTIQNWIRKVRMNIDIRVDHRKGNTGRKKQKILTLEDYKERYEILKKYQAFLQARRGKK